MVSMIELLPALWLPTQMMEGKSPVKEEFLPEEDEESVHNFRCQEPAPPSDAQLNITVVAG